MEAPKPVVLLTDFGTKDPYVGQMKSQLLCEPPYPPVIDLTHEVPAQNETVAAFFLEYSLPHLPADSVVLLVVDPFVGTKRNIIAAKTSTGPIVISPDRGFIDGISFKTVHLVKSPVDGEISQTFHGRDWFAPAGRRLALGESLESLGPKIDYSPDGSLVPKPVREEGKISGEIVHIDRFGNLITNIPSDFTEDTDRWHVSMAGKKIELFVDTYGKWDEPVVLVGSYNYYEISLPRGSAENHFNAGYGDSVQFLQNE